MKIRSILSALSLPLALYAEPLAVDAKLPDAAVRSPQGVTLRLTELAKDRKTVFVFYRGGWCPYCNTHLAELVRIEPQLLEAGWQIIAISPDSPAKVRAALAKTEVPYQLLSDSAMNAAKAFGLAFNVDDEEFERLKGFGIDIEADSGENHRMLPVPGVFLVDETGTVTFAHHDPDYKKRLSNEDLLKAAGIE